MNNKKPTAAGLMAGKKSLLVISVAALSFGCHKSHIDDNVLRDFSVVNLTANAEEYHPQNHPLDSSLINAFGIAWSNGSNAIAWVNSVGGHVSELYNSEGISIRPGVKIPTRTNDSTGLPCGIVFSGGMGFRLGTGTAAFIFSGFDGVISAWNGGNNATRVNRPTNDATSYTGLAIGATGGKNYIYAANFGEKKIDVWDTGFHKVNGMSFIDPGIPSAYSPYNIQAVGDSLYVMYGQLATDSDPNPGHGVAGPGKGFVSIFKMNGQFVRRFASRGSLNLPWGVTMAPGSFLEDKDLSGGEEGHGGYNTTSYNGSGNGGNRDPNASVILVGSFGDGHINVFTRGGDFLGQLQSHKHVLEIEGLWALVFPPSTATALDPHRLYFSAGPDNESDGVFGYIIKQ